MMPPKRALTPRPYEPFMDELRRTRLLSTSAHKGKKRKRRVLAFSARPLQDSACEYGANLHLLNFSPSESRPLPAHVSCLHCSLRRPSLRSWPSPAKPLRPTLLCVALDDHLVVADENRHGPWTLVPTLPQQGQRQLQAVGAGPLNWCVETVGQPLDIRAAPAGKRSGICVAT